MSDPCGWSIAQAARALRARHVSPRELVAACLARIERWQPRINAFVAVEAEAALAAEPRAGPLAGVPLAHKDMFYRAGRVSNCGSKIRRGWIADATSTARSNFFSGIRIGSAGTAPSPSATRSGEAATWFRP